MASRRTRIKGIANIPQRRKTGHTTNPDEPGNIKPEIEQNVESEKPNLKAAIVTSPDIDRELPQETPPANDDPLLVTPEKEIKQEAPPEQTPTPQSKPKFVRRKLIKPPVALNVSIRKHKEDVNSKEAPADGNRKIIILNEIISYSNNPDKVFMSTKSVSETEDLQPEITQSVIDYSVKKSNSSSSFDGEAKKIIAINNINHHSDLEYPIPPPSPSKINRTRIKAVPRLSQRHTSASESEDDSRRNYNRHRNDSVCSTASGVPDNSSLSECLSPQKPKEFNSVIQRKCRRTEQSRKLAEARRDFMLKFPNNKPDRQKLTMIDLIFYNPTTNPMSHDSKPKKESVSDSEHNKNVVDEEVEDDPDKSGSDEENEVPAPQIKIGPSGEIVVDEKSLVIENKAVKKSREELQKSQVVDGNTENGYGVYKRVKRSKDWSKAETLKFYRALNTIGTDFTLMCELFPRRTRRELKMKFKKEERINKNLVDRAVMEPCGFDFEVFKHEVDMEEKELREIERQKEKEQQIKLEAKRKRKQSLEVKNTEVVVAKRSKAGRPRKEKRSRNLDILDALEDDDSDADESEVESEDDQNDRCLLRSLQKPTRSGRIPKIIGRYTSPILQNSTPRSLSPKVEPGSLMVVASSGPKGDAVYKVFMMTGENSRQQLGQEVASLSDAMKLKGNYLDNIFTLTATKLSANNGTIEEIPEENNVTISHENETTVKESDLPVGNQTEIISTPMES